MKAIIDEDLQNSKHLLEKHGNDLKKMSALFDSLILKYKNIVNNISDNLDVIFTFDSDKQKADIYKNNINKIVSRLETFKYCSYNNELLAKHYINEGVLGHIEQLSFDETKNIINKMEQLSKYEKDDIIKNINDIESIISSVDTKKNKWYSLRPYLLWASGKEVDVAILILSLIIKIN